MNHQDTKGTKDGGRMGSKKRGNFFFVFLCVLGALVVRSPSIFAYELETEKAISAEKPVRISASKLTYDRLLGLTHFKGDVRAVHDDVVLTAEELRALSGNRQATAEGNVRVTDDTVPLGLTCGNLEYQDLMNLIVAHGSPVLESRDEDGRPVTVQGRRMDLDSQKKVVKVHQDVVILHDEGDARAGRAVYIAPEDKFVLEEDPRIEVRHGWLTGRRITSHLGGEKSIIVEGNAEGFFHPKDPSAPGIPGFSQGTPEGSKGYLAPPVTQGAPGTAAPSSEPTPVPTPAKRGGWGGFKSK